MYNFWKKKHRMLYLSNKIRQSHVKGDGTKWHKLMSFYSVLINTKKEKEMKLISWNVNGLRAVLNKGFADFFKEAKADIFCVQETKMQEGQAEIEFNQGYYTYFNSAIKKGYSGTAVFTKKAPISVSYGIGIEEHDKEGRIITLEFEKFYVVNCYTPNSKRELERLEYRQIWEDEFRKYLSNLNKKKRSNTLWRFKCST